MKLIGRFASSTCLLFDGDFSTCCCRQLGPGHVGNGIENGITSHSA